MAFPLFHPLARLCMGTLGPQNRQIHRNTGLNRNLARLQDFLSVPVERRVARRLDGCAIQRAWTKYAGPLCMWGSGKSGTSMMSPTGFSCVQCLTWFLPITVTLPLVPLMTGP